MSEPVRMPRGKRRFSVLAAIAANPDRSTGDIARILGVVKPAVTIAVNTLENVGLVKREPNRADRRRVRLSVTQAGRDALAAQEVAP